MRLRIALGIALLLLLAGAWTWISSNGETSSASRRWQSSVQCRSCHEAVWQEWYGSHHQIAYLNPEVRKLSDDFRNRECRACHLPRPVSATGYAKRTLPRFTRPDEGVGCLSCHLGAGGEILGRRNLPGAPCQPRASQALVSVELCESCHNQHQTTDQWRASAYPAQDIDCGTCHMPETDRALPDGSSAKGRGHVFPGAHDVAMLRQAGRFEMRLEGGSLILSLENVGAGHNFPTEERHRAVDMLVRFAMADGSAGDWERAYRFRSPYRDEPGEDTQLPAGETVRVPLPIPDGAVRAQARLWYRLTPYVDDADPMSTLLEEKEIALR
ncbi:MAG: multiheme c-type cytochrome [Planctomycetota bacterium]